MQAEYIASLTDGEAGMGVLMGGLGHESALDRTDGVRDSLAESPNMEILCRRYGSMDQRPSYLSC